MNKHFAKLLYLIGIFLILFYFSLDVSKSFNLSTIARPILSLSLISLPSYSYYV